MIMQYHKLIAPLLQKNAFLQFGWEVEYSPADAAVLLQDYSPLENFITKTDWEILKSEQKIDWLRKKIETMAFGDKSCILEKNKNAPSFLPQKAYRDDTKNIEIRSDNPISDFQKIEEDLAALKIRYGAGSMQLVISEPANKFFLLNVEHQLGWLIFFNELDILEKLAKGYALFRSGYEGEIARNFQHPYLGPMNRKRRKNLLHYLTENSQGKLWGKEDLVWVGLVEKSFKFVGSTAYRPDIAGPERICFEVRDAHKDLELLLERASRIIFYWLNAKADFSNFAKVPAFDTEIFFDILPPKIQKSLEKLFPCKAPSSMQQYPGHMLMQQTYRNFAYPLRDWGTWLAVLGADTQSMIPFQASYVRDLQWIADNHDLDEARIQVQRALGKFASESPLLGLLRIKEKEIVDQLLS